MFERILVAFDGSERGRDALMLADALVSADGELVVCCVHPLHALSARVDPTEPRLDREAAQQTITEATAGMSSGATVTPMFLAGVSTASAIQEAAARKRADLIVLGSSHRGKLGRVLVGDVGREMIHAAIRPVAIAPAGFHRYRQGAPLMRVAVAYEVADPVSGAVPAGVALCEKSGSELLVVAIVEGQTVGHAGPGGTSYAQIATDQALTRVLAGLPGGVRARSEVREGDAAGQLLEVARDVDLLVLGSHGRGLVGRLVIGSVCDAVVRAADCPVLVMPPSDIPDVVEFERRNLHQRAKEDIAALSVTHEQLQRTPMDAG